MIRNAAEWQRFERELLHQGPHDPERNLRLYEAMFALACRMGAFPPSDPLAGVDVDIRLAEALNVRRPPVQSRG